MDVKDIMENIGLDGEIDTRVIRETPVITLRDFNYNDYKDRDIYLDELKRASVGEKFSVYRSSCCGRDVTRDTLTILVKNENGVLCHLLTERSSDEPCPERWTEEELLWFSYERD